MDPRTRLVEWRRSLGISADALGKALGCSAPAITRIETGHRLPGRRLANAIERATHGLLGGPIRASDWDALEDSEREAMATGDEAA